MSACKKEESVNYDKPTESVSKDPIDVYFQDNFQDKYGCAIRWKWIDKYVDISYVVAPADRSVLIPTGDMLRKFWIEPFLLESKASGDFIRSHFPPEIVCVGSELRNADGTRTLGYADAGVRITLTELNLYNLQNRAWVIQQLHTVHHEFSHIIHQIYGMPIDYNKITTDNYTGQAWSDLYTEASNQLRAEGINPTQELINALAEEYAIAKGMLTPYGTSSEFEDFAEVVALYLLTDPTVFANKFLINDAKKPNLNQGKAFITKKVNMTLDYYSSNFKINLTRLRDIIQERLNEIK